MKFAYTIIYVQDVAASLAFFERAFGLQRGFVSPGGEFGTLATVETSLSFCQHDTALDSVGQPYVVAQTSAQPLGMEVGLGPGLDAGRLVRGAPGLAHRPHRPDDRAERALPRPAGTQAGRFDAALWRGGRGFNKTTEAPKHGMRRCVIACQRGRQCDQRDENHDPRSSPAHPSRPPIPPPRSARQESRHARLFISRRLQRLRHQKQ